MKSLIQIILFASVVTLGSVGWAVDASEEDCLKWQKQSNAGANSELANEADARFDKGHCKDVLRRSKKEEKKEERKEVNCKGLKSEYIDAKKDYTKACSNIGGKGCDQAKASKCADESGSELGDAAVSIGASLGMPNVTPNACSEMTGQDYTESKRQLEEDVQKINKDIQEAQNILTEEKKKLTEQNKALQEEMAKNQETFDQLKIDIADSKRAKLQKMMEEQEKLRRDTENIQEQIFKEKEAMTAGMENLNIQLMQMTDAALESSCMKDQVTPMVEKYKAEIAANPNAAGKDSTKRRQELNRLFDECMAGTKKAREAKSTAFKRQQDASNRSIDRMTAQLDSNQKQLQSMQSNLQQELATEDTKQNNAYQKMALQLQQGQQHLYEYQSQLAEKERSSTELIAKLRMQLFIKQNEIAQLGPVPVGGVKGKGTFNEVVNALVEKDKALAAFQAACCKGDGIDYEDEKDEYCKKPKDSEESKTRRRSSGKGRTQG